MSELQERVRRQSWLLCRIKGTQGVIQSLLNDSLVYDTASNMQIRDTLRKAYSDMGDAVHLYRGDLEREHEKRKEEKRKK